MIHPHSLGSSRIDIAEPNIYLFFSFAKLKALTTPLQRQTDVVFLLDASTGVSSDLLKRQKEFVKSLATHFNLSPIGPRGAALLYANNSNIISGFRDPNFNARIHRALLVNTSRRMDQALLMAAQYLMRNGRSGRKIVILLTAGRQAPGGQELDEAVKPLSKLGAQFFVVAIGQEADSQELLTAVERVEDIFQVTLSDRLPSSTRSIAEKIQSKPRKLANFPYHGFRRH